MSGVDDDAVGFVGADRDEVVGNHFELVAVDAELELAVGGDVYQADEVFLARMDYGLGFLASANAILIRNRRAVEGVGSVDKEVIEGVGNTIFLFIPPGADGG